MPSANSLVVSPQLLWSRPFPELTGHIQPAVVGWNCGWSDSPKGCIGTGTDTTPGKSFPTMRIVRVKEIHGVVGNGTIGGMDM